MKADFELLLRPKNEGGDLQKLFWESFNQNSGISYLPQTGTLSCHFPDNNSLQFKAKIRKTTNTLYCRLEATVDVHWRKAHLYDDCRSKLKGILGKVFKVTFYADDLSSYYAKKCYPILNHYETNLRKILYILFHFKDTEATQDLVNKKVKDGSFNRFVENLDLSELEMFLFERTWLSVGNTYEFCNINKGKDLYEKIQALPTKAEFFSSWEIWLGRIFGTEFIDKKTLQKIRELRNKVAHHKTMSYKDWEFCREEVRAYANKAHAVQEELLERELDQTQFVPLRKYLSAFSNQIGKMLEEFDRLNAANVLVMKGVSNLLEGVVIPKIEFPKAVSAAMGMLSNTIPKLGFDKAIREQVQLFPRIASDFDRFSSEADSTELTPFDYGDEEKESNKDGE